MNVSGFFFPPSAFCFMCICLSLWCSHLPSSLCVFSSFSSCSASHPVFTGVEAHCQLHIPLSLSSCSLQLFRARFLRSSGTGLPHIPRFPSQPPHLHVAKPHVWARSRLTGWSNQHFIQVDAFFKHFRRFGSRASLSLPRWPPLHHLSPPS